MTDQGIGASVKRKEDRRFLLGKGNYVDDIRLANQSYAVFVRSMYAHAKITNVDTAAARAADGVIGVFTGDDIAADHYTLYTTSQNPHVIRLLMAAFTLHIPEHKLRVVAPDVGGGFGSKIFHYAEELMVTWASKKVGRPVKWTADRSEAFISDAHGRDHITHAALAL